MTAKQATAQRRTGIFGEFSRALEQADGVRAIKAFTAIAQLLRERSEGHPELDVEIEEIRDIVRDHFKAQHTAGAPSMTPEDILTRLSQVEASISETVEKAAAEQRESAEVAVHLEKEKYDPQNVTVTVTDLDSQKGRGSLLIQLNGVVSEYDSRMKAARTMLPGWKDLQEEIMAVRKDIEQLESAASAALKNKLKTRVRERMEIVNQIIVDLDESLSEHEKTDWAEVPIADTRQVSVEQEQVPPPPPPPAPAPEPVPETPPAETPAPAPVEQPSVPQSEPVATPAPVVQETPPQPEPQTPPPAAPDPQPVPSEQPVSETPSVPQETRPGYTDGVDPYLEPMAATQDPGATKYNPIDDEEPAVVEERVRAAQEALHTRTSQTTPPKTQEEVAVSLANLASQAQPIQIRKETPQEPPKKKVQIPKLKKKKPSSEPVSDIKPPVQPNPESKLPPEASLQNASPAPAIPKKPARPDRKVDTSKLPEAVAGARASVTAPEDAMIVENILSDIDLLVKKARGYTINPFSKRGRETKEWLSFKDRQATEVLAAPLAQEPFERALQDYLATAMSESDTIPNQDETALEALVRGMKRYIGEA